MRIELEDENDFLFQTSVSLAGAPATDPDKLSFWAKGEIRVFITHRDHYKREAKALGDALKQFGISCFVAHDTIEPMESWQHQIEKALETMEVFIALVTDDFHESVWCNQEVGFAKARNVPVICLKLGAAPQGFIADKQALPGDKNHPENSANDLYKILAEKLGKRDRLQGALVTAFCETPNWNEARWRFDRLDELVQKLEDGEITKIKAAYESNDQLHNAIYLHTGGGRLKSFLLRTTGQKFIVGSGKMVLEKAEEDEEIPF